MIQGAERPRLRELRPQAAVSPYDCDTFHSQHFRDSDLSIKSTLLPCRLCLVQGIPVSVISNLGSSIPLNFALFVKALVTQIHSFERYEPNNLKVWIFSIVIPFIPGEEDKIQAEACKILGSINEDLTGFINQPIRISVACNRVPVLDGHTVCVSIRFTKRPPPSVDEIRDAMKEYVSEVQTLGCFSAPQHAIVVLDESDRPQPRLDRETERVAVSVGRIREDPSGVFDIQFVALSHNTVLGAAGSSILNAEAVILQGYI